MDQTVPGPFWVWSPFLIQMNNKESPQQEKSLKYPIVDVAAIF
jgi:hypothetical protein